MCAIVTEFDFIRTEIKHTGRRGFTGSKSGFFLNQEEVLLWVFFHIQLAALDVLQVEAGDTQCAEYGIFVLFCL